MRGLQTSALLSLATLCAAEIVNSVAELPCMTFDFVVVGGGTAGNVIANRLTENPNFSVLVLEAGPSNEGVLNTIVPFYAPRVTSQYDWNYTTVPQRALNGTVLHYTRGHILGGSSSVNYLAYTRGTEDDFNDYARLTGDEGFSWHAMQPYMLKSEMLTPPADHHNTTGQVNPAVHGRRGIVGTSLPGYPQSIDERVIRTTQELSQEFPYNEDANSGKHLGIGWDLCMVKNGARSSSATSYLGPEFRGRPNLHVLLNAHVTRLRQTGFPPLPVAFRSVEFVQNQGVEFVVHARKEVILAAGAINTPHLLMNSGIGDAGTLAALGIKPIIDLPSVGQNLTDHPIVASAWRVNGTETLETANRNATLAAEELERWNLTRTGPLVDNVGNHLGWLRLPSNASIFERFPDPSAGPDSAHFELIFTNGLPFFTPPTGNYLSISTAVVSPLSRGSVTLNSSNPQGPPLIDPNFFDSEFDLYAMREGIRSARRFLTAPVWADYIIEALNTATTDDELDQYIRSNGHTIFHACGTAAMSPKGASWGVIDPDFKVKSVAGLRIVDASVFPRIPTAHTTAPVYIFAEKAASLIKATWRCEDQKPVP